jgi:hypothetical protein
MVAGAGGDQPGQDGQGNFAGGGLAWTNGPIFRRDNNQRTFIINKVAKVERSYRLTENFGMVTNEELSQIMLFLTPT